MSGQSSLVERFLSMSEGGVEIKSASATDQPLTLHAEFVSSSCHAPTPQAGCGHQLLKYAIQG